MRIVRSVVAAVLGGVLVSSVAMGVAQDAEPAGSGANAAGAISAQRAGGGANAASAMGRPADPNSPEQAGRQALYGYLDGIAAKDEAVRREAIAGITTRAQAELRQQEVRAKVLALMGGGFTRTPLNAKVVGSTELDGFRVEKVLYESQPGFYVTALLYVPEQGPGARFQAPGGKWPAVVMAPGHASSGKAGDFAMASLFARNGFVVLSYDPIGQGERLQYMDPKTATTVVKGSPYAGQSLAQRATGEHGEAGLQPTLIGDAVARYFAWDGMRAVDYLVSRPEVDAEKIGAFGCSGGGAMTALLGAADKRVKAVATACYLTTMDELLPSIGAQDAEQSVPGWIASGFDFADWVELAAPRAYAMVGTVGDMFPWAGFVKTAQEARRFYGLFDKSAEGVESSQLSVLSSQLKTPTGPTLNPDTTNAIPESSPFQVIAGIGGHGNLKPIQAQIVGFFLVHLAGRKAEEYVGPTVGCQAPGAGCQEKPVPAGALTPQQASSPGTPVLQVTATGQVATSFPGSETVHSLTLKRAKEVLPKLPEQTLLQVQTAVRMVTGAEAVPGDKPPKEEGGLPYRSARNYEQLHLAVGDGIRLQSSLASPVAVGRHPATLLVTDSINDHTRANVGSEEARSRMNDPNTVCLSIEPRPSPAGGEETKAGILGPFYLTELRAELVGKTLLGMRVDDVIRAVDYLAARDDVDAKNITVVASGHMGLVALHAAVLDARIKHVTVDHVLESYRSLLEAPMPVDAPQDVLPGVLMKYDVPDLVRVLGDRVTFRDPLPGSADLGKW